MTRTAGTAESVWPKRTTTWLRAIVAAAVLTVATPTLLSAAPTAKTSTATIANFKISMSFLPPEGGHALLMANVTGGVTCAYSVTPSLSGFPYSGPCGKAPALRTASARGIVATKPVALGSNASGKKVRYAFKLSVSDGGGQTTTSASVYLWQRSYGFKFDRQMTNISKIAIPTSMACATSDPPKSSSVVPVCLTGGSNGWMLVGKLGAAPTAIRASASAIVSISCASALSCMYIDADGQYGFWNGKELSGTNPFFEGGKKDRLRSVSCPSVKFCMSVGDDGAAASFVVRSVTNQSLSAKSWGAGSRWVSCVSATQCLMVGDDEASLWELGAWKSLGLVDPGYTVTGISCSSSARCVVVDGGGGAVTLDLAKSASSPPRIFIVLPSSGTVAMRNIQCPSPTYCLGVDAKGRAYQQVNGAWSSALTISSDVASMLTCVRYPASPVGASCAAVANNKLTLKGHIVMIN